MWLIFKKGASHFSDYIHLCALDTSRCVAEKKYTEQQAKKLFPQVFVPVCNPDGTYSEVRQGTELKIHKE